MAGRPTITIDREGFLANVLLSQKGPCRVATTANITLSGIQSIDGVTVSPDDRVLVKNQTNGLNGIYVAKTGDWELADDFDQRGHLVKGTVVVVTEGTVNAMTTWVATTSGRPFPGRETISFSQYFGATGTDAGTAGYHLQSDGTTADWAGFVPSGSDVVTRTWQAKARDLVTITDWGAVGDGTTDDTTAVTNADADTRAKFVPEGTYDVTLSGSALDGPYWGFGQIRDSSNNLRAPWFSAIKAAPSSSGTHDSVVTAFNGDLSKVQIAMEHRITGTATLGQPASGYLYTPEAYAQYGWLYNESGHNEATASNDGRTAAAFHRVEIFQVGQGDSVAFNAQVFVNSTRTGSTSFLANPAGSIVNGDMSAGQAGVYLNAGEFFLDDGGFDVAGIGWVVNMDRSVTTGAKNAFWAGFRAQSVGSADVNAFFSASGACDVGLDFSHITTDASKAAIALKADDRIYGNSSSSNGFYATALGTPYIEYSSTRSAWHVNGVLAAPINLFTVASVNFNSANTDTSLTISLPSGYTRYRISNVVISGASASLTTATFGLFTAAAGGGTAVIASGTAITVSTASEGTVNNMQTTAPANVNTQSQNETTLFFRVQTPQGSAATATVSINYTPVS